MELAEVFSMLKTIFILILIAILAAFGAAAAFKILSWLIGALVNIAIVVAAFMGIMFLIRKLRAG
jgi:hypothetical protein